MTTLHVTNDFNAEASINAVLASQLAAITPPAWLTFGSNEVVVDWPDIESSTPCFSLAHFQNESSDNYQGRGDGAGNNTVRESGLMEISAWVSRDQYYNGQSIYAARLRYMESMIKSVCIALPIIVLRDYTASLTAPPLAGFKVNFGVPKFVQTAHDPNSAIERRRALVGYFWDLRA